MKKRSSRSAVVCLVFFIFFFLFQINMSKLFKSKMAISPMYSEVLFKSPENLIKSFKAGLLDPLPEESPSSISCNRSSPMYDLCTITGPTFLDPNTSTFYPINPSCSKEHIVEKIKPYPRKWENFPMTTVKELTISSGPSGPKCQVQHNVPAIVFSASGYTGNFYHEFNDGFIPLFITVNSVFPENQDFIMVISDANEWWQSKYSEMLQAFSKHRIINLHNDTSTHCFTSATLGLISHGSMTIDPTQMPSPKTLVDFRDFLDRVYSHGLNNPRKRKPKMRPRLVLVSRTGNVGRVVLNQNEVQQMAEEIGFEVILFEPKPTTQLYESYKLINSSHAMVGVHGAALTHSIFLRPGAVFMQVVPLGLEKIGETCYASPARAMGLEYMEYMIGFEESSLTAKYGENSSVVKDPDGLQGGNWTASIMNIYLKEQNVQLALVIKEIKGVGWFRVIVFEPTKNTSLAESYKLLNRTHAMIGVHGAALAHFLLMRTGSAVGEIVPIGTDWLAKTYFEKPAMAIGMEYLRYKISAAESSLKNPNAYTGGNWSSTHVYYLKKQNVKLDVVRFRKFLKEVFENEG